VVKTAGEDMRDDVNGRVTDMRDDVSGRVKGKAPSAWIDVRLKNERFFLGQGRCMHEQAEEGL